MTTMLKNSKVDYTLGKTSKLQFPSVECNIHYSPKRQDHIYQVRGKTFSNSIYFAWKLAYKISKGGIFSFVFLIWNCIMWRDTKIKNILFHYWCLYEGQSKSSWTILITCKLFDAIWSNLQILYLDTSEINLWRNIFTNITEWCIFISLYAPG